MVRFGWGFWIGVGGRGEQRRWRGKRCLTGLRVRVCRVEPLEWGTRVGLHKDHCVAAFVTGGYLYSCRLCEDVQGHDHTWEYQ